MAPYRITVSASCLPCPLISRNSASIQQPLPQKFELQTSQHSKKKKRKKQEKQENKVKKKKNIFALQFSF